MGSSIPDLEGPPLDRTWFARHPAEVAFTLVGAWVVVDRAGEQVMARIVETEAYGGLEDGASHSTMYRVGRETLGSDAGVLYMQRSYGLHTMTNIVAHTPGNLGAVLLRAAADPVLGFDLARSRRDSRERDLLVGPGNLSRGLGTHLSDTLKPVNRSTGVWFLAGERPALVLAGPRIGITRSIDAPWRFFDGTSRQVSRHRRGDPVHRSDLPALVEALGPTRISAGS